MIWKFGMLNESWTSLRDFDVEVLQRICTKVNVIPVIAKADTFMPDEILACKKQVIPQIQLIHFDDGTKMKHYATIRF
jgi:septin family protein